MLGGKKVRELYELKGKGRSMWGIPKISVYRGSRYASTCALRGFRSPRGKGEEGIEA